MAARRLPAEERRKQLLRAATRVFARRGFHGATTKQIAAEAEVAEALLYRYFPSKLALFCASVEETSTRLLGRLKEIFDTHPDDPIGALTSTFEFYRRLLERNQELAKMVFMVTAELDDPEIRAAYLPFQERALETIASAIRDWKQRGLVSDAVVPGIAAWLIMGAFHVVTLMRQTDRLSEIDVLPAMAMFRQMLRPTLTDAAPTHS